MKGLKAGQNGSDQGPGGSLIDQTVDLGLFSWLS